MKEFLITENEEAMRLDNFLRHVLKAAPDSFLQKMLRKKNITLNDKKAAPGMRLKPGDSIKIYFSDETFLKFQSTGERNDTPVPLLKKEWILWEDEDVLVLNKPKGLLSQKAKKDEPSINEMAIAYSVNSDTKGKNKSLFTPSVVNRLDRNTSGILLFGKTRSGLQSLSDNIQKDEIQKYYRCVVVGMGLQSKVVKGYLKKNEQNNTVTISDANETGYKPIETGIEVLATTRVHFSDDTYTDLSLLEVHLITGRTHQIRAQMAHLSYPIVGDYKYGNDAINQKMKKTFGIDSQMLHAYCVEIPGYPMLISPYPKEFYKLFEKTTLERL